MQTADTQTLGDLYRDVKSAIGSYCARSFPPPEVDLVAPLGAPYATEPCSDPIPLDHHHHAKGRSQAGPGGWRVLPGQASSSAGSPTCKLRGSFIDTHGASKKRTPPPRLEDLGGVADEEAGIGKGGVALDDPEPDHQVKLQSVKVWVPCHPVKPGVLHGLIWGCARTKDRYCAIAHRKRCQEPIACFGRPPGRKRVGSSDAKGRDAQKGS